MNSIQYLKGDASVPQGSGDKMIVHICNDTGGWGKGFVLALSKRWPEPEKAYRHWYRERAKNDFALGAIQVVAVEPHLWVVNMVAQHTTKAAPDGTPPIRYAALRQCLTQLAVQSQSHSASIHMPRIGCGLAGGKWECVEPLIQATLVANGIAVTVYDY